jgi:hypothetical protein
MGWINDKSNDNKGREIIAAGKDDDNLCYAHQMLKKIEVAFTR